MTRTDRHGMIAMDWLEHRSRDDDDDDDDGNDDDDEDDSSDSDDFDRDGGKEPIKFFTNELSCKGRLHRLLISNPTSRIYGAVFDVAVKVMMCVLYVVRVCLDDPQLYACEGERCSSEATDDSGSSTNINWYVIVWVHRPLALWVLQVILCLLTSCKAVLYVFVATKGNVWDQVLTQTFLLEMLCSLPLIATMFYPVMLKDFFVPLFLNCWLAKGALRRLMNDLHLTRQKFQTLSVTLNQQICFVAVTVVCIIFTTICGIQHIQRSSSERPLNMFEAVYFAIVTLSTVGYGDISPDIWLGQLFMMLMICVAFAFIPKQIEEIGSTWAERKKTGGDYGKSKAENGKHVVVCASSFSADVVINFLNEFYEHPKVEGHTVILMSSEELDSNMLFILKDPKWAHRVVYIKGSPLKDIDLKRCRINNAESVFFLGDKNCPDQDKSDQHTILRSWAVKDFAPDCRQYIQLFKATSKQHVRFAEHVVCEDEFKFALLANNCLYPGLSTLVTLILYTSRGTEGDLAEETWQRVYGRHSGNEIYHIQVCRSVFFNRFEGRTFTQASAEVHDKLGVCLLAVLDSTSNQLSLKLNPGPDYVLKGSDYCFYMSETKEEYSEVTNLHEEDPEAQPMLSMTPDGTCSTEDPMGSEEARKRGVASVYGSLPSSRLMQLLGDVGQDSIMAGPLPNSMPVVTKRIICHLHCEPRPVCCTLWGDGCEHCTFNNAGDPRWSNQLIIVSVDECCPAVYNFIIPLRSSYLSLGSLYPVILLVNNQPDSLFLETIAHFPLVFWMKGSLRSLDDLLKAGIHKAIHLVISNIGATHGASTEERLGDAETAVMVQKLTRLFPSLNIITEMKEDSNMRFMHFQAQDSYTQQISKLEKRLKEKTTSNLPYMFRLPFAAGQVFSSAMLDRLLYQTFVKGYLICFVRLLLGIDAQRRSGHLSSVQVNREMVSRFPTYGDLYQGLCSTTGEIPIGLYRTERRPGFNAELRQPLLMGNNNALSIQKGRASIGSALYQGVEDCGNVTGFINSRLQHLNLGDEEPYVFRKPPRNLSYVIVNPTPKRRLRNGDMIYVLQPSTMQAVPGKLDPSSSSPSSPSSHHTSPLSRIFHHPNHPKPPPPTTSRPSSSSSSSSNNNHSNTIKAGTEHSTISGTSPPPYSLVRWEELGLTGTGTGAGEADDDEDVELGVAADGRRRKKGAVVAARVEEEDSEEQRGEHQGEYSSPPPSSGSSPPLPPPLPPPPPPPSSSPPLPLPPPSSSPLSPPAPLTSPLPAPAPPVPPPLPKVRWNLQVDDPGEEKEGEEEGEREEGESIQP
ncbi:potassium channel subfamily T member 2-like isoform X3 [Babylonia areolata]|uniref:potassium channel subfamily T member 2-like isoform X3 n=1 Tax=Babylonia areolata TaxID=304850 RepID=UPI003FD539F0